MSCYLAILATISAGDEVIIPAPYWVSYPEMVKLAGGKPVVVNAEDVTGFKITPAQLTAALTPKTRMVIINSPSNPTGAVYSRAELEALVAICVKANVWIMSDEIYENLVYDGQTTCSPATFSPEAARLTITVSGYAKSYSMTGWRLGTLVASDKALAAAVADLQSQISSNATTFAQFGALAVHQHPDKAKASLAEMGAVFDKRRLNLLAGLNAIPGLTCYRSQGAFYLFPNIKSFGLTSAQFADRLLEEELMAVVPGSAFGSEGYIRLSYATSDQVIAQGLERLARFCAKLKK
jgi:aspartate aminotransferase